MAGDGSRMSVGGTALLKICDKCRCLMMVTPENMATRTVCVMCSGEHAERAKAMPLPVERSLWQKITGR